MGERRGSELRKDGENKDGTGRGREGEGASRASLRMQMEVSDARSIV